MRTKHPSFATVTAVVAAMFAAGNLTGCGLQPGRTEMTFSRGSEPPPPKDVSRAGEYFLYPANSGNPVTSYELSSGDQYGFRKRGDGTVVGFVSRSGKDIEINLPGGLTTSYYWKLRDTRDK